MKSQRFSTTTDVGGHTLRAAPDISASSPAQPHMPEANLRVPDGLKPATHSPWSAHRVSAFIQTHGVFHRGAAPGEHRVEQAHARVPYDDLRFWHVHPWVGGDRHLLLARDATERDLVVYEGPESDLGMSTVVALLDVIHLIGHLAVTAPAHDTVCVSATSDGSHRPQVRVVAAASHHEHPTHLSA